MPSFNFFRGAQQGLNSGSRQLGMLPRYRQAGEDQALLNSANIGYREAMARKAAAEAALKEQENSALQGRPVHLRNSAVAMSGATEPEMTDFEQYLRSGQMPTRVVEDDAMQQSRVEPKYNWSPQQQERMRAAVQSVAQALGATGHTNAEQLAKAAGELQQTGNLQTAVSNAAAGLPSRQVNAYLLKPGQYTNRPVGSTGATLDELTGRQDVTGGSNPLWERFRAESVSRETENQAQAGNAAAHADLARTRTTGESAQNVARYLDKDGNVVEVATAISTDPKTKARTYQRLQLNPQTGRFDLPMQPGLRPVQNQGDPLVAAAVAASMGGPQGGPKWAGKGPAPAAASAAPAPNRTAAGSTGGIDQEAARREANQLAIQREWKVGNFVPGRGWEMFDSGGKLTGYADGKAE